MVEEGTTRRICFVAGDYNAERSARQTIFYQNMFFFKYIKGYTCL